MNKFIGIGNISTDIDLQYTPNGNAVAKFNVAFNDRDDATFLPIEVWKKQAENISTYCKKGSKIAVDGMIKVDQWEKDGQKRSRTKVVAFNIQYLDPKSANTDVSRQSNTPPTQEQAASALYSTGNDRQQVDINDSDLPF